MQTMSLLWQSLQSRQNFFQSVFVNDTNGQKGEKAKNLQNSVSEFKKVF